jgi:hypothetical protein
MNLFIIILSFILFNENYIDGLNSEGSTCVDVLGTLKTIPNCDLQNYVKSETDYKQLTNDLTNYCSTSDTSKQNTLICCMLSYELKKACGLSGEALPSKAVYKIDSTSAEICGKKNVKLTSEWILKKITNNGKNDFGVTADDLCTKVTSDTNTLRLARFFYKVAPRVRQDDLSKQNKG